MGPRSNPTNATATAFSMSEGTTQTVTSSLSRTISSTLMVDTRTR